MKQRIQSKKRAFAFVLSFTLLLLVWVAKNSPLIYANEPPLTLDLGGTIHVLDTSASGIQKLNEKVSWDAKSSELIFDNYTGTYVEIISNYSKPSNKLITIRFIGENRLTGRVSGGKVDKYHGFLKSTLPLRLTGDKGTKLDLKPLDFNKLTSMYGIQVDSYLRIEGHLAVDIQIHCPRPDSIAGITAASVLAYGSSSINVDVSNTAEPREYAFLLGISATELVELSNWGGVKVTAKNNGDGIVGISCGNLVKVRAGTVDIRLSKTKESDTIFKGIGPDEIIVEPRMKAFVGLHDGLVYGGEEPYHHSRNVRYASQNNLPGKSVVSFSSDEFGKLEGETTFVVSNGTRWGESKIIPPEAVAQNGYRFVGWEPALPSNDTIINANLAFKAKFEVDPTYSKTVDITFVSGGNGQIKGKTLYTVERNTTWEKSGVVQPGAYPDKGFVFAGWEPEIPYGSEEIKKPMTFTARFERSVEYPRTVVVSFMSGGDGQVLGQTDFESLSGTAFGAFVTKIPDVDPYTGYEFVGWEPELPSPDTAVTSSMLFRAKFKEVDFPKEGIDIIFLPGEQGHLEGKQKFHLDEPLAWGRSTELVPPKVVAKPGYTFTGWDPPLPELDYLLTESMTFTAQYKKDPTAPKMVNVRFVSAAGGKLSGNTQYSVAQGTLWKNAQITVPSVQAEQGYVFKGWNPKLPTGESALTQDITFTAEFEKVAAPKMVNVRFVSTAGGKLSGNTQYSVAQGTLWKNAQITVPSVQAEQGYVFKGWNPKLPTGESALTQDITFTAEFEKVAAPKTVNVRFVSAAGGKLSGNTQYSVAQGTLWKNAQITVPSVQAEQGYVFKGWNPKLPTGESALTQDITFTAEFEKVAAPKMVNVRFVSAAGGKLSGNTQYSVAQGTLWKNAQITVPSVQAEQGYVFKGWNPKLPTGESALTQDITFTAEFEKITTQKVEVRFVAGAHGSLQGRTSFLVDRGISFGAAFDVPKVKADSGYRFDRWEPKLPDKLDKINGNATYTAIFVEDKKVDMLTLTLVANNGTNQESRITVPKGQSVNLPNNPFAVPRGYVFDGWNVEGKRILPGERYQFEREIRIYAMWKASNSSGGSTGGGGASARSNVRPDGKQSTIPDSTTPLAQPNQTIAILKIGSNRYQVAINGRLEQRTTDVAPMIHQSRTMLPARLISELLGVDVEFNNAIKSANFVYITKSGNQEIKNQVELTLGRNKMKVNGVDMPLSAQIINVNGRILMPITDVQKALKELGLKVDVKWNHLTKEVTLERIP